jgi:hypothetical protein
MTFASLAPEDNMPVITAELIVVVPAPDSVAVYSFRRVPPKASTTLLKATSSCQCMDMRVRLTVLTRGNPVDVVKSTVVLVAGSYVNTPICVFVAPLRQDTHITNFAIAVDQKQSACTYSADITLNGAGRTINDFATGPPMAPSCVYTNPTVLLGMSAPI